MDVTWSPVGDDAAGWLYTRQTYDWKGRPRVTTNTDGTQRSASYQGCGCAGGEVVTTQGEAVPIPGTTSQGSRTQKVYHDALGRAWKAELLNWDGSVYSTTESTLDALDRATVVRQYQGTDQSGVYQEAANTYDGYGRLQSSHAPEQDAGHSTAYAYNADDTPASVTDARGAVTTYSYTDPRGLLTGVTHSLSGSNTLNVTYSYDAAGNRKRMDDSQGWATYAYDQQSRMTSETRYLNGPRRAYTLGYDYNLAGQLKTLADPFGSRFTYTHDAAGRLTDVTDATGTPYAGAVNTYVGGVQYRAWGGVKSASFGDHSSETVTYDSRMRPGQFRLTTTDPYSSAKLREDFSYYADGRLQSITDLDDGPGATPPSSWHYMSRAYSYDHAGRVLSGAGTAAGGINAPFNQTYGYDEFDDLKSRSGSEGYSAAQADTADYTNNRRLGWTYDADGRLSVSPANSTSNARAWAYDAAGGSP